MGQIKEKNLRLLDTPVDEQWVLWACKNKLCDPQRHSFHFEQVPFQSMLPRLRYQHTKTCRQTDGPTDRWLLALYMAQNDIVMLSDHMSYDLGTRLWCMLYSLCN